MSNKNTPLKPVADFKKDLKEKGQTGEDAFQKIFPLALLKQKGTKHDFCTIWQHGDEETIELKTDYYSNPKNFFMEHWSSIESRKPGGPWQSLLKDPSSVWYIYYFINTNKYYIFKTAELVEFLNKKVVPKFEEKQVRNINYTTVGYAVPISILEDLCYEVDLEKLEETRAATDYSFVKIENVEGEDDETLY